MMFDLMSSDVTRQDQEVVELPLLLPRWQAVELEAAARRRGMTTGQMIRRVIGDMLAAQPALAKSRPHTGDGFAHPFQNARGARQSPSRRG